jgi:hypothetical protein
MFDTDVAGPYMDFTSHDMLTNEDKRSYRNKDVTVISTPTGCVYQYALKKRPFSDQFTWTHILEDSFCDFLTPVESVQNVQQKTRVYKVFFFMYKDLGPLARSETVDQVNLSY